MFLGLGLDTFSTQFTWSQGFPLEVPELAFLANVECQGFRHSSHMCHSKEALLCCVYVCHGLPLYIAIPMCAMCLCCFCSYFSHGFTPAFFLILSICSILAIDSLAAVVKICTRCYWMFLLSILTSDKPVCLCSEPCLDFWRWVLNSPL